MLKLIQTPPRLPAAWVPLLVSLFMALAYNAAFWRAFVSAAGKIGLERLPLLGGSFLLLVAAFNLLLTLINFRYLIKPALMVLFLSSAAISYFMDQYGTRIDGAMVQNLLETDRREAFELLSARLAGTVMALGVLPALMVWRTRIEFPHWRRDLAQKLAALVGSFLLSVLLLLLLFKSLAPLLREHRELRLLLAPTNAIQALSAYFKAHNRQPVAVAAFGRDAVKQVPAGVGRARSVTVLVIGETARAANFSLNGYRRVTNPQLARQADLINFPHVTSCGTATAVSVPCLFSGMGRKHYSDSKARAQEGLLDVLRHASFEVVWRDNNSGCKGACDRVLHEDVSRPLPGNPACGADECWDERLLQGLPQLIANAKDDLVVVLHQMGSHGPAYWKRYPPAFQRFGPVCDSIQLEHCSRAQITAAYDNTILYTDHVLSETIALLRQAAEHQGLNTAMLYVSDHGESLGEGNLYLHGAPYLFAPSEQKQVPMLFWSSAGYRARFRIDQLCLAAHSQQEFSHDNIFHSVLGMLKVNTAVYQPDLDMFKACTVHG